MNAYIYIYIKYYIYYTYIHICIYYILYIERVYTVFPGISAPSLFDFKALRCGAYRRAARKIGKRLFQRNRNI